MAIIEERTNSKGAVTYRAKVRIKGYPVQSASFKRKTDAKIWAQNTESAIHEGRHFSYALSKRKTFADMIDRYIEEVIPLKPKSAYTQTQQLNYWKDKIGHMAIAEVTPSVITALRNELASGRTPRGIRSRATVNRYLAALNSVVTS